MDQDQTAAIVFDAYGTLFDIASLDAKLIHYFGDEAAALAGVWRRKQLEYTWLRSLMQRYRDFIGVTEDALVFACKQLGLTCTEEIKTDLLQTYHQLEVYPEVPEALDRLNSRFELAILSNGNLELLQNGTRHNGIGKYFKSLFSVDSIRQYKPMPFVYQLAVDGLRIPKSKILFVSSNTWDVAGAKSFGMQVAWIRRQGNAVVEELGLLPDMRIADLLQLNAALA